MTEALNTAITWILASLASYGYVLVFCFAALENIFIVGSFVPGDLVVAAAAFTATTDAGASLSPWVLIALASLGSFVGGNISYWVGRGGGRDLIERSGPRFGIDRTAIEAAEEYFNQHGSETVLLAKFIAVLKNVAPAVAGASKMSLFWFELYTILASIGYSAILVGVGWFLGANFRAGLKYLGAASWLFFAIALAVIGALLWAKFNRDERLIGREAARFESDAEREAKEPKQ